jgi:hypothetical protein
MLAISLRLPADHQPLLDDDPQVVIARVAFDDLELPELALGRPRGLAEGDGVGVEEMCAAE